MRILSQIKSTDFLGESINFSINKQPIFQTVAGGSLGILIYLLYVYLFYIFGINFIFKKNPNVYSQMRTTSLPSIPKINLTGDDFIFGIRLEDTNGKPISYEEYAYANVAYFDFLFDEIKGYYNYTQTQLEMTSCDKFPKIKDKIPNSIFNLSTFICPDISKNSENKNSLEIGGIWEDNQLSYLHIFLTYCKDADKKICIEPQKLINKSIEISDIYIVLIYPEVTFNPNNYTNPFEYNFKYQSRLFNPNTYYRDELYLGYNHLNEDAGVIFEASEDKMEIGGLKLQNGINHIDYSQLKSNDTDGENKLINDVFHSIFVYFDRDFLYHTRRYMKLQDLLANVSGFMDLVLFIIGFLYKIYNKFRLDTYLFNRLVHIKGDFRAGSRKINNFNSEWNNDNSLKKFQIHDLNKKSDPKQEIDEKILYKNKSRENIDLRSYYTNTSGAVKPQSIQIPKIDDISNSSKSKGLNEFYSRSEPFYEVNNASSSRILKKNIDQKIEIKQEPPVYSIQINPNELNFKDNSNINKTTKETVKKINFIKILKNVNKPKNDIIIYMLDYFTYTLGIMSKNNKEKVVLMTFLDKYLDKIYENFDIFKYLKLIKSFKYVKKLFLEKEELSILNKLSEKSYAVKIDSDKITKFKENEIKDKNDVECIIDNFLCSNSFFNEKILNLISCFD